MKHIHQDFAESGRWHQLSMIEQLGNIGSEFNRALSAKNSGKQMRFEGAFGRMLDLFQLTLSDPRWRGCRLRESARMKELAVGALSEENVDADLAARLSKDFLDYALIANRERHKSR